MSSTGTVENNNCSESDMASQPCTVQKSDSVLSHRNKRKRSVPVSLTSQLKAACVGIRPDFENSAADDSDDASGSRVNTSEQQRLTSEFDTDLDSLSGATVKCGDNTAHSEHQSGRDYEHSLNLENNYGANPVDKGSNSSSLTSLTVSARCSQRDCMGQTRNAFSEVGSSMNELQHQSKRSVRKNLSKSCESAVPEESDGSSSMPETLESVYDAGVYRYVNSNDELAGVLGQRAELPWPNQGAVSNGCEKPFKCPHCPSEFLRANDMKVHVRIHTGERPYKCPDCSAAFARPNTLKNHRRTHTGERPYRCAQCPAAYTQSVNLKKHMKQHTGETLFQCSGCPAVFSRASYLRSHEKSHYKKTTDSLQTLSDGDTQNQPADGVASSVSASSVAKPFKCPECPATFAKSYNLDIHFRVHTGEKPYKCQECPVAYRQKSHLNIHMRTHTGEKPYMCTECPAAFARSNDLKTHIRTHTGERPHICSECSAAFTEASGLTVHMRIHTGEKPYKCAECQKAFTNSSNLKRHIKTHFSVKTPFG